jgi:seryl-tRNA synthetase
VARLVASLGLHHRVVEICAGDMGQSHHRSFDVEVYAPGCGQWLEVSSVSWLGDYQARRADIRYRPVGPDGSPVKGTALVHTLNGSGLGIPRTMIALIENNQNADGTINVPEALRPLMGGVEIIGRASR